MREPTTPQAAADWLRSYRGRLCAFARDVLRVKLYRHQEPILDAIDAGDRVAVRAGRGVGKSFAAEVAAVGFVATRPKSRCLITGPQFENSVVSNLIPGIHALLIRSPLLASMFAVTTSAVFARSDTLKRAHRRRRNSSKGRTGRRCCGSLTRPQASRGRCSCRRSAASRRDPTTAFC